MQIVDPFRFFQAERRGPFSFRDRRGYPGCGKEWLNLTGRRSIGTGRGRMRIEEQSHKEVQGVKEW